MPNAVFIWEEVVPKICKAIGLAGLIVTLLAGGALGQSKATTGKPSILPTDKNLLFVGRWDKIDPSNFHGNWIGSYVRTSFAGTSVSVMLGGRSGLVFAIDGMPAQTVAGGPGVVRLNSTPLAPEPHTLLVGVKGGGGWDFQGLVLDAGAATQPPAARPIIEFVGDSITCGSPAPIEAAGNYAWLTAEALDCDHTQIAWPGRSLMTGYGFQEDKVGLDIQYFQQNCFYDSPKLAWDFSTYTPEMVVINLGQNDGAKTGPEDAFLASYVSFLRNIRAQLPLAQIVAMRPFGGAYAASIGKAVATLNDDGDARVRYIDTTGWLEPADFADGVHPGVKGNEKAAGRLAPLLKALRSPLTVKAATPPKPPVTIGDPANPGALANELQDAYRNGARDIVIRPGTYTMPVTGKHAFFLKDWKDVTIRAPGCTIIALDMHDIFNLTDCNNVTLQGPVILRHVDPCGTQGRVTAIGTGPDGKAYCDWQVDKGYGTSTKGFDNFDVIKQETRTLGRCDLRNFTIEPLGGSRFRIHWSSKTVPMQVNDWLVHRYSAGGCAVRVSNSRNCWIKGVASQNGGHATFFESDGSGGNHFLNCVISCGPKPPGATEEQLVSNWADGLHSIGAFPGPDIQNFTFSGILLDDCIAIRGVFCKVLSSDPANKKVILNNADSWLIKAGEPIRVVGGNFIGQANVVSIKNRDGKKEITLDQPLDAPADADCYSLLRSGAGYRIVNCKIGGTRSRGIIAKGDNGLIRGCTITDCGTGILLGPGGGEAGYYRYCTVFDNEISNCRGVGMTFESNGHIALRDTRIFNNRFLSNPSWDGDLILCWVDGVVVSGNTFTGPSSWQKNPKPPITVERSRNVRIAGNDIKTRELYAQPLLKVGKDVEKLTEDVSGVRN